jgi:hypothetical protein
MMRPCSERHAWLAVVAGRHTCSCSTWSAATHNMWQHVGVCNLKPCAVTVHYFVKVE